MIDLQNSTRTPKIIATLHELSAFAVGNGDVCEIIARRLRKLAQEISDAALSSNPRPDAAPTPPSTGVTPKKKAKKDLILTKAKAISDKTTWFHGTNTEIAALIRLEGFKEDTWFSRHMEDAVKFGGPHVFVVKMMIDNAPLDWQIHMANALPPSIIVEEKYVAAATGVTEGVK